MTQPNDDADFALVTTLGVRTVNLTFGMKRTVKDGDSYHSFEASESWTFKHPDYDEIPPSAARRVAHVHGPALIRNVVIALTVGGVLDMADAKALIERVRRTYDLATGGKGDATGDQPDLPDTGHVGDRAGADPGIGDSLPATEAPRMPGEAEHVHGPDRPSEPGV